MKLPVVGYEDLYEVSECGRVFRIGRVGGKGWLKYKELQPAVGNRGYLRVQLSDGERHHHHLVHRLVAAAFHDNPENLPQVNHKDRCKTNNHKDNLEWITGIDNAQHAATNYTLKNPDGEVVEITTSLTAFCKERQLIHPCMVAVIEGHSPSYKGWECVTVHKNAGKVAGPAKVRSAFWMKNGQAAVEVYNMSQFCRKYNLNINCLIRVRNGDQLQHKGWMLHNPEEDML